jgi:hypothetical protein
MVKTQLYFPESELAQLHAIARRRKKSVAALVREAVREVLLAPEPRGPVGLWDGKPRRASSDHDAIYDEP